ncbi:uncharacterized protein STEHIDRAFT_141027 [Stereum hirsutum FP-91666 SS1]|uniref:uncharacterized protein n=1 Tax=Stereum hirsutum (strain FP-91666) TaxID=721885 RepID=UPI0004449EDA|nr:uncharacterized protein STEHIDRAFT_141027 [Stereum hirsutum FP-91666 SS1]EIM84158.1 hypothetical protein STEHIDRAFT_141027 [Stereum hirsutum FP-91666 SS1]
MLAWTFRRRSGGRFFRLFGIFLPQSHLPSSIFHHRSQHRSRHIIPSPLRCIVVCRCILLTLYYALPLASSIHPIFPNTLLRIL